MRAFSLNISELPFALSRFQLDVSFHLVSDLPFLVLKLLLWMSFQIDVSELRFNVSNFQPYVSFQPDVFSFRFGASVFGLQRSAF